jgi:hypothetical protein
MGGNERLNTLILYVIGLSHGDARTESDERH